MSFQPIRGEPRPTGIGFLSRLFRNSGSVWRLLWVCLLAGCVVVILWGCGPGSAPTQTTTTASTSTAVATPELTSTPNPISQLERDLELVDNEMNAARSSLALKDAKAHAEVMVNVLVGRWGRSYGDADKDGKIDDPSDGRGVFPGERLPNPAPDTRAAELPFGWGIAVYDSGGEQARKQIEVIMGDPEQWKNRPRQSYDEIDAAVASSDVSHDTVSKLAGRSMRSIAWARLILTKASSLDDARAFANYGIVDTGASLEAAKTIK